ncbi:MAG: hypothetical protein K8R53_06295 [Bacteroidales bacterium]|nr:hypothetical protein [Bacteroidales bacterium]
MVEEFEFLYNSLTIIETSIEEFGHYYPDILNTPFNFSMNETVEWDADKLEFARDEDELKERWRLT